MLHSSKCWWLWKQPVVGWHWWLRKEPVLMCGNWNVGQATSQQVFKVTTLYTDTCFQSFSPLINCIVHHDVLKSSPCRYTTLPQLVRIADWYFIHLHHAPDVVMTRVEVRTVGWSHVRTDELSPGAEAQLCREHDVMAHCLAGRQTRLQQCCGLLVATSVSATRLGNTARWLLFQAQQRWDWYISCKWTLTGDNDMRLSYKERFVFSQPLCLLVGGRSVLIRILAVVGIAPGGRLSGWELTR